MSDSDQESTLDDINEIDIFNTVDNKETEDISAEAAAASGSDEEEGIDYDEPENIITSKMSEKIKMHKVLKAEDSRMPDVMSSFEYVQMIIAGASLITNRANPGISTDCTSPVDNAIMQIMTRNAKHCILRTDANGTHVKWTLKDIAYFPAQAVEEFKQFTAMHPNNYRE